MAQYFAANKTILNTKDMILKIIRYITEQCILSVPKYKDVCKHTYISYTVYKVITIIFYVK